jgi:hypothetical protein
VKNAIKSKNILSKTTCRIVNNFCIARKRPAGEDSDAFKGKRSELSVGWILRSDENYTNENPKGRNHFGKLGVDGRIILKWILKKGV